MQTAEIYISGKKKVGYLTERVNPGVCPAGAVDPNLRPKDLFQGAFQDLLNSDPIGLNLPAVIVGPVVFDG